MTTKVSYDKLESVSYSNVFDLINTRSNIADPRDPEGKKIRTFVYDSDPFEHAIDFNLTPYIILTLPLVDYPNRTKGKSLDGSYKLISWKQTIMVRTSRHGSSNANTDVGRTDMLNICDALHKTFNSSTRMTDNYSMGMHNFNLSKINSDPQVIDGVEYYESEYELTYDTRLKVTA